MADKVDFFFGKYRCKDGARTSLWDLSELANK